MSDIKEAIQLTNEATEQAITSTKEIGHIELDTVKQLIRLQMKVIGEVRDESLLSEAVKHGCDMEIKGMEFALETIERYLGGE